MGPSEFRFPFLIHAFFLFLKVYANLPNETDSASTPSMEFAIPTPRTMCGGVVADEREGWHVIYNTNAAEIQDLGIKFRDGVNEGTIQTTLNYTKYLILRDVQCAIERKIEGAKEIVVAIWLGLTLCPKNKVLTEEDRTKCSSFISVKCDFGVHFRIPKTNQKKPSIVSSFKEMGCTDQSYAFSRCPPSC